MAKTWGAKSLGHALTAMALSVVLGVSACGGNMPLSNMFGGGDRTVEGVASAFPPPTPDARGVVTYGTYQVMIARDGDSLPEMAARVGLLAEQLAAHNGLPVSYSPRPGEVIALPENVGGDPVTASIWSEEIAASAIDNAGIGAGIGAAPLPPIGGAAPLPGAAAAAADNPFANGQGDTVIDPIRHRVRSGETAFSIARRYGVSTTALASWNGLDNEMTVRENQELLIPVLNDAETRTALLGQPQAAPAPVAPQATNAPGTATPIAPPPSSSTPLPDNEDLAAVENPPSPNLIEDRTPAPEPAASPAQLAPPVSGASVLRGYAPTGNPRNEGIDFAAAAGTPVTAAGDGEVALVSESLGELGTIVLVRHPGNLMTVYGRVTDVALEKGDSVSRGQRIGVVADGATPNVHFEVREGTASVDPGPYLGL
ncbi:MAG: LysM peptidoglycan-binding domain-containing M23 family metallopeptidase [Pseudomonadota bacterium]